MHQGIWKSSRQTPRFGGYLRLSCCSDSLKVLDDDHYYQKPILEHTLRFNEEARSLLLATDDQK